MAALGHLPKNGFMRADELIIVYLTVTFRGICMLTISILISRYIFFGLTACCFTLGVLSAKGFTKISADKYAAYQRAVTVAFHALAFTLLAAKYKDAAAFVNIVVAGCGGLVLLAAAYRFFNAPFFNCAFFLFDMGYIMITRLNPRLGERQLLNAIAGLLCMAAFSFLYGYAGRIIKIAYAYMAAGAALIALPFFIGNARYGALNWITAGPFSFQPSELVKLLFVLYLAEALPESDRVKALIVPSAYGAFLTAVLVLQRDLGGALIIFVIFIVMLYIKTGKTLYAVYAVTAAAAACAAAYFTYPALFAHVGTRVSAWQNPWRDIDAAGYQIAQALFAIGTWGLMGSGLALGFPGRIPVAEKDFIFPAVCEEFGVLTGVLAVGVFAVFLYYGYLETMRKKGAAFYASAGLLTAMAFQFFLSLGGNIKLIPHTGVTLPFMSYGGSSLVVCLCMVEFIHRGADV